MANPYELWETRKFLGVFRDIEPEFEYFLPMFTGEMRSEEEWIDFEKMPVRGRKVAPFVQPLARGAKVYEDTGTGFRFKPAYAKLEDEVDPLAPLRKIVGIDMSMLEPEKLTPMQRHDLIRAQITAEHVRSIRRRWEVMACRAIVDGKVTLTGENYPTTLVDFKRDAGHTVTLGVGERFGDSGVSIVDFFQEMMDLMNDAKFGGVITRATMGGGVWAVMRKDAEFREHLDLTLKGGNITIERGLVNGTEGKIFKVGEMLVGGQSGQKIELWVNNETYIDPVSGADTRYIGSKEIVFTASPASIMGFRCFGRIIDRAAEFRPLPIFPRNWLDNGDPQVEHISHKSAPLMVPINPNCTIKATVLA